ncbi:hypothetical protein B0J14DRAFT_648804 [Halenospora varia]|nr:hypothetical protein B0J14DRAFT_648804 [Halenospora varia]
MPHGNRKKHAATVRDLTLFQQLAAEPIDLVSSDSSGSDEDIPKYVVKKSKPAKRQDRVEDRSHVSATSKKTRAESDLSDEDELRLEEPVRRNSTMPKKDRLKGSKNKGFKSKSQSNALIVKPKKSSKAPRAQHVLNALHKAADYLSFAKTPEELETWLLDMGFGDDEKIAALENSCSAMSEHLKSKSTATKEGSRAAEQGFDEFYIHRNKGKSLSVLAPITLPFIAQHKVDNRTLYVRKKVFGFIRRAGASMIKMYAISGYLECLEPRPDLLDSENWLVEVKELAKHCKIQLRSGGYDESRGVEGGSSTASHVEPGLMLYWAKYVLGNAFGPEIVSAPDYFKEFWRLRGLTDRKNAELFISDKPCPSCRRFQEAIEAITGITFTIKPIPNTGPLKCVKNKYGQKDWKSDEEADTDEEVEEASEDIQVRRGQAMVLAAPGPEIEVSSAMVLSKKKKHTKQDKNRNSSVSQIRSYLHVRSHGSRNYDEEDDIGSIFGMPEDDTPITPQRKVTRASRSSSSGNLPEFGFENLKDIARAKSAKKRKREEAAAMAADSYPSPTSAKKPKTKHTIF